MSSAQLFHRDTQALADAVVFHGLPELQEFAQIKLLAEDYHVSQAMAADEVLALVDSLDDRRT
jgi:hypothetical protein